MSGADEDMQEVAFQYGRNLGIAFQLVDDQLDFVATASILGKPTVADLKMGMATAPVLFACEKVKIVASLMPSGIYSIIMYSTCNYILQFCECRIVGKKSHNFQTDILL